ncbi:MAG: hypothetical protein LBD68_06185 [Zoogloeaceae bacterium]|jgi:hypothetical protein|nr:hypothetical protein [Zoogloeaceae bacterium]
MTPFAKSMSRTALLAFLLIASGAGIALFGQQARERAALEARMNAALLSAARDRLQELRGRKVERLAAQLAELEAQGFFAAADSASLAARLQAARGALGMGAARSDFSLPQRWGDDGVPLWQNELSLELDLNHEQEFADFWRVLEWPGPLRVTDCDMARVAALPPSPGPNLRASCRLQWLSGKETAR